MFFIISLMYIRIATRRKSVSDGIQTTDLGCLTIKPKLTTSIIDIPGPILQSHLKLVFTKNNSVVFAPAECEKDYNGDIVMYSEVVCVRCGPLATSSGSSSYRAVQCTWLSWWHDVLPIGVCIGAIKS